MAIEIPLKKKYLLWRSFREGAYRQRTGNSHGKTPKIAKGRQGTGPRRRAYNTHNESAWGRTHTRAKTAVSVLENFERVKGTL